MSYNTPASAKILVGETLPQEILDEAQQMIHQETAYRWEATSVVDNYSSKDFRVLRDENRFVGGVRNDRFTNNFPGNEVSIFLKMPITTMSSVVIGGVTKTEDTDFELKDDTGEIRFLSFAFIGDDSLTGLDDIVITYTYGYTSSHKFFKLVQGVEARIGLLLYNNPLLLAEINLQGDVCKYGDDLLSRLLKKVPKKVGIGVLGK